MGTRRLLVFLLAVAAIAWTGTSLAGTDVSAAGRCEDRLVETLAVQMSGPGATSRPILAGFTYKVAIEGPLSNQYLSLNVNGVDPGWSPLTQPRMVLTTTSTAVTYGTGVNEDIYAGFEQQGAGLKNAGTCVVSPRSSWKTLPGAPGPLAFAPVLRAGVAPDTRTLTVKIFQSVWVETGTPTTTTTSAKPSVIGLWSRNGRRYRWASIAGGFAVLNASTVKLTHGCTVPIGVAITRYLAIGGGLFRSYSLYYRARPGGPGADGLNCSTYWKGPLSTVAIRVSATRLTVSCDKQPTRVCRVYTRLPG